MKLTCVVDNAVTHASPLWAEHGLAFIVETGDGKVLFDTGQSGTVLRHNLKLLKTKPRDFSAIVVSHGHYDHTGGMAAFLERAPNLPLIAHPAVFTPRYASRKKKSPLDIGLPLGEKKLRKLADVRLKKEPFEILSGLWTTGEIRERPEPEGRSARHVVYHDGDYVPDPYTDDLSLVWKGNDGLVVILGCAHAGVLNILAHAAQVFAEPIQAVVGGMHLHDADGARMEHVQQVLAEVYRGPELYPNHCTGTDGFQGFVRAFGERVKPCPVGTVLKFD